MTTGDLLDNEFQVVDTASLYIRSANRTAGSTTNFSVSVQDGFLIAEENERLRVTLEQFNVMENTYVIGPVSNTFSVLSGGATLAAVTIADGTYTDDQLAAALTGLTVGRYTLNTVYNAPQNSFTYTLVGAAAPFSLNFAAQPLLAGVLGFAGLTASSASSASGSNHTLTSGVVTPRWLNEYCLYLTSAVPGRGRYSMTNQTSTTLMPTTLLGAVPATGGPFQLTQYVNDSAAFGVTLSDRRITQLSFQLLGGDGTDLSQAGVPDFSFVLKIEWLRHRVDTNLSRRPR